MNYICFVFVVVHVYAVQLLSFGKCVLVLIFFRPKVSFTHLILCPSLSDDLTGQVLAYISLLPIAVLVGFVTLIMFKRELHTVSFYSEFIRDFTLK